MAELIVSGGINKPWLFDHDLILDKPD